MRGNVNLPVRHSPCDTGHVSFRRRRNLASSEHVNRITSRLEGEIMRTGVGVIIGIVIGIILVLWILAKVVGGIF